MDHFLQKLKKVVHIVLYRLAISQSDCREASPYHLLYNDIYLLTGYPVHTEKYQARSHIVRTERSENTCRVTNHLCRATKNVELLNDVTCCTT